MPVFTKRIKNATSFIQAIEPLDEMRMGTQSCTRVAKRIKDATSLLWATRPLDEMWITTLTKRNGCYIVRVGNGTAWV